MDTIASRTKQRQSLWLPISTRTRNRQVLKNEFLVVGEDKRKKRKETNGVDGAGRNRKKYKGLVSENEMRLVAEMRLSSNKASPQPDAPQPSQREYLRGPEKVFRKVFLAKGR
nr:hypothetical protein CFP56_54816 [Quercus suber]